MKNKKIYLLTSLFLCSSCSIVNFFTPKAKVLKEPVAFRNNIKKTPDFDELAQNIRTFSADFSVESSKELDDKSSNNVVSPLSMFSALAVASACSSGNTKQELLTTLKTTDLLLQNEFANLYSDSNVESTMGSDNKVVKKELLTNSIWIDKNINFNTEILEQLAEYFYCYSLNVDFRHQSQKANRQISKFVEEKTNGLIAPKFEFDSETRFTILNTLYLKSLWNIYSYNLDNSPDTYTFTNRDGSTKSLNLFMTDYEVGRVFKADNYSSFFAQTARGDRVKFIVPNEGVNLENVITPETILEVNNQEYEGVDEENKIMYKTKTFFPGFEAEADVNANDILKKMGIHDFFDENCDFSGFLDDFVYCDSVQHVAKLKVDKKGIEGAAYTAIDMKGEIAPFDEYENIFEEFVVDKAFYYVVSDHNNLPMFSGIVNKI